MTIDEAKAYPPDAYRDVVQGDSWGEKWGYYWFRTTVAAPQAAEGQRLMLNLNIGAECTVYVNGIIAGSIDKRHFYITLSREANEGEAYEIYVEGYAGHQEARPVMGSSGIGIWREDLYQFLIDVDTLYQIRCSVDEHSLRAAEIDRVLARIAAVIDLDADEAELMADIRREHPALKPLLACTNGSTTPTLYMMGQSHLDVAWLWPIEETKRKIARTISNQLALMEEYPEYIYTQSQPYLYQIVQHLYPELYERLVQAVRRGQLIPEGGMWLEADTNLTSGESLIRQFIHGKRFFREQFGVDNEMLWMPDVFGYSGSLPQIMKGCGIRYFASVKMGQTYNNFADPFPYNTFLWEGIDGSEVLVHFMDYHLETKPSVLIDNWNQRVQKDGINSRLAQFGYGDGGGGATRDELEYLRRCADLEGVPKVKLTSPIEYFKDLERQGFSSARYVGELYYPAHRGTYTTQAKTKQGNRRGEFALREAELWGTAAVLLRQWRYPLEQMDALWKTLLLNQFHDILPGTSIARVHAEAEQDFGRVIRTSGSIAAEAQDALSVPQAAESESALSVFNSLSWARSAVIALPQGWSGAADANGQTLAAQQDSNGHRLARVELPPCGWVTITRAEKEDETKDLAAPSTGERILEHDLLRIELDEYGRMISVWDKERGMELTAGPGNDFRMYKDTPPRFDAWEIDRTYELGEIGLDDPAVIRKLADGPLTTTVEITRKLHRSTLRQHIVLTAGSRVILFRTKIDWQEKHKLLKVDFPTTVHASEAIFETQFGYMKRPTHRSRPHDADRFEVSHFKWAALAEEARGCAVMNDGKYGMSVLGGTMSLTLLRASTAPDPQADLGEHEFAYAFYPWNGSFLDSGVVRHAYELNCPATARPGDAGSHSLCAADRANIVIDTVKPTEDGSGDVIIRMYEAYRTLTECELQLGFPVRSARRTNMLEQPERELAVSDDGKVRLRFKPFEIITVRLSL
ncbi:Mannosylglycerate hydrolase [Paenibacillus konkukensis]|uniref:Mannosylglycerate hydrolase n=1 Tax=Paenibacillus konkukensis TaxID=2020716 RepID=A0ABY4RYS0_9BACL|nr:glycoside hydrolase family 38 C-terminal domain-containing protein [Paenibacillus konkukensis]UQZ87462.1 Mannosylglycerate hydrolase [Paenibacillus konkukensis]